MRSTPFKQVDVFTQQPFLGNPVAVILQAEGLSDEEMQRIARWTNLSETTFVLPATQPRADYRLRIFTPGGELPFAGHPTIGSAHALLESGAVAARDGVLVQECSVGLVRLQLEPGEGGAPWIAFELPQPKVTPLDEAYVAELESILGRRVRGGEAAPRLIDVGARWVVAQLEDAQAVLACRPDFARMKRLELHDNATGVTLFGEHAAGAAARIEVRSFAPASGIEEDPVCGSGNGCVAVFIRDSGLAPHIGHSYVAAQGTVLGRAGRVRVGVEPQRIRVAGQAVTCIDGRMAL